MGRIGHVATCRRGRTGLVLSVRRAVDDELVLTVYRGICIDPGMVGNKWESRDPQWVGTLDEWAIFRALLIKANEKE